MLDKVRLIFVFVAILSTGMSAAQSPARLRTPVVENRGQVAAAELERQAQLFPRTFFLEGPGERKQIAFTFDDGPSADTPALLDVLKQQNIKATFFWQGQNVLQYPEIVKRAFAEGHTLANHSFSHPNLSKMEEGGAWWDYQIQKTQQAYQKVLGFQPALMRPPYGFLNDSQVKSLQAKNMAAILWSVDSADWFYTWQHALDEVASAKIEAVIQQYIHPEAIVLMHDSGGRGRVPTIMAVKALIPALRQQGYQFTTVDQLLGIPAKLNVATAGNAPRGFDATLTQFFALHNLASNAVSLEQWAQVLDKQFVFNTPDGVYRGIAVYADYLAKLQQQFPGMKLELSGKPNQVNDQALFGWRLLDAQGAQLAQGVNSVGLSADGRIKQANVFMEQQLR